MKRSELHRVLAKFAFHAAQGGKCGICAGIMRGPRSPKVTFDHVWPRSRHPVETDIGNLILAHERCNTAKANRLPTGCELIMLQAVNARFGFPRSDTAFWEKAA